MGSKKESVNGRTRIIIATALPVIPSAIISGWHFSVDAGSSDFCSASFLAMTLRNRCVRRKRMLAELVSGKKKNRKTRQKPDSQTSSQIVQVQPLFSAAKPPIRGPRMGPSAAAMPQTLMPYATFSGAYMSAMEAPPVARAGLPKNPVRKRKARSMPKFLA